MIRAYWNNWNSLKLIFFLELRIGHIMGYEILKKTVIHSEPVTIRGK